MTILRWVTLGLTAAGVLLAPARAYAQEAAHSGRILHVVLSWTDSTRPEPWTNDTADRRALLVHAYYREGPAEAVPLVLFSTGRNVGPGKYEDLAKALVGSGYIVAVVDHLGERSGQKLPSGATVPNRLDRAAPARNSPSFRVEDSVFSRRWVELRADDMISARAHLQSLASTSGSALSGRLSAKAAAIGHSLGGLSAAKACERDPAFAACANLDGLSYSLPMHVDGDTMIARQPFMFIGKPMPHMSDEALKRDHMTRAEDDEIIARMERRFDALMSSGRGGGFKIVLQGTEHMDFAADGDGATARIIRANIAAFLDQSVRGIAPDLRDVAPNGAGVSMTRYLPRNP